MRGSARGGARLLSLSWGQAGNRTLGPGPVPTITDSSASVLSV